MVYGKELKKEEGETPVIFHRRLIEALHYRGTMLLGVCILLQTQVYSNFS